MIQFKKNTQGMGFIKLIQQTDIRALKSILFDEDYLKRIKIIEYSSGVYLKLKNRGIIIYHKCIIISLTFYTTKNLGCIKQGKSQ